MIEAVTLRSQTDNNIAQALAIGELRKHHAEKLIPTGERLDAMIAMVSCNALAELVHRKIVEQLSKDGPSTVHAMPSKLVEHGNTGNSSRLQPSFALPSYKTAIYTKLQKVNRTAVVNYQLSLFV
jgi:hypothetical protein